MSSVQSRSCWSKVGPNPVELGEEMGTHRLTQEEEARGPPGASLGVIGVMGGSLALLDVALPTPWSGMALSLLF